MDNNTVILAENLSFAYRDKSVLDNLNFAIKKGERIGIVGESGCGKTTLLHILSGLLKPTAGLITVLGAKECENIRKNISIVMQEAGIMPLSIRENITLGHEIDSDRLERILSSARLTEWCDSLPEGVDTYLGDSAGELSGGQAQRIAIARAMAKDSEIILLDEPTSALDKETAEEVMKALYNLTEGKTVITVTHQQDLLKDYHKIYRLEGGRLYEQGSI